MDCIRISFIVCKMYHIYHKYVQLEDIERCMGYVFIDNKDIERLMGCVHWYGLLCQLV